MNKMGKGAQFHQVLSLCGKLRAKHCFAASVRFPNPSLEAVGSSQKNTAYPTHTLAPKALHKQNSLWKVNVRRLAGRNVSLFPKVTLKVVVNLD